MRDVSLALLIKIIPKLWVYFQVSRNSRTIYCIYDLHISNALFYFEFYNAHIVKMNDTRTLIINI